MSAIIDATRPSKPASPEGGKRSNTVRNSFKREERVGDLVTLEPEKISLKYDRSSALRHPKWGYIRTRTFLRRLSSS